MATFTNQRSFAYEYRRASPVFQHRHFVRIAAIIADARGKFGKDDTRIMITADGSLPARQGCDLISGHQRSLPLLGSPVCGVQRAGRAQARDHSGFRPGPGRRGLIAPAQLTSQSTSQTVCAAPTLVSIASGSLVPQ